MAHFGVKVLFLPCIFSVAVSAAEDISGQESPDPIIWTEFQNDKKIIPSDNLIEVYALIDRGEQFTYGLSLGEDGKKYMAGLYTHYDTIGGDVACFIPHAAPFDDDKDHRVFSADAPDGYKSQSFWLKFIPKTYRFNP